MKYYLFLIMLFACVVKNLAQNDKDAYILDTVSFEGFLFVDQIKNQIYLVDKEKLTKMFFQFSSYKKFSNMIKNIEKHNYIYEVNYQKVAKKYLNIDCKELDKLLFIPFFSRVSIYSERGLNVYFSTLDIKLQRLVMKNSIYENELGYVNQDRIKKENTIVYNLFFCQ